MTLLDNVKKTFGFVNDEKNEYKDKAVKILKTEYVPYNPFTNKDGSIFNKYIDYQQMLDNPNVSGVAKDYIKKATGLDSTYASTDSSLTSNAQDLESNMQPSLKNYNAQTLGNMDMVTELPKLSTGQISKIISTYFNKSKVITPKDAEGIYNAQQQSGVSALAMLGIGALESGYGTSNIAEKKNNIWGYGAVNSNPLGGAHSYSQMSDGAIQFANQFKDTYYNKYGAKSIYSAGTGSNPAGKGYAYYDNGAINKDWASNVSSIMNKLYSSVAGDSSQNSSQGSSKAQEIINTAKKYIGTPYVWGGETPKGFDCSGLMKYVFNKNGVSINRTASEQFKNGKAVDKSSLQPGDLVFFKGYKTYDSPGHVGLYIGNNQYIQAPKSGDTVKISNLSDRGDYAGARRVI